MEWKKANSKRQHKYENCNCDFFSCFYLKKSELLLNSLVSLNNLVSYLSLSTLSFSRHISSADDEMIGHIHVKYGNDSKWNNIKDQKLGHNHDFVIITIQPVFWERIANWEIGVGFRNINILDVRSYSSGSRTEDG